MSKETLVRNIVKEYGIKKFSLKPFSEKKRGKVWIVEDDQQKYILKGIKRKKSLFPIYLQHELNKINMAPKVYKTLNNKLYISKNNRYYFLSSFINDLNKLTLEERIFALAQFHKLVRFNNIPKSIRKENKPNKKEFIEQYKQKILQLKVWREKTNSQKLKKKIGEIIELAEATVRMIIKQPVSSYLNYTYKKNNIYHGDFHLGNSYITSQNQIMIIDLDWASFGPPIYDFRFVILSIAQKNEPADSILQNIQLLFKQYFNYCQEYQKFYQIYVIDAIFPHYFHQIIDSMVRKEKIKNMSKRNNELIEAAKFQHKIAAFLKNELLEGGNYINGKRREKR